MEKATREQIPLDEAEQATLGFTHSDSGRILAEAWKIPSDIADAIELHHQIGDPERGGPLVALVHLSDLLCRMRDLGYGYYEPRQVDFANEPGWLYLVMKFPSMAEIDLARFTFSLDEYAKEVSDLVATVFALPNSQVTKLAKLARQFRVDISDFPGINSFRQACQSKRQARQDFPLPAAGITSPICQQGDLCPQILPCSKPLHASGKASQARAKEKARKKPVERGRRVERFEAPQNRRRLRNIEPRNKPAKWKRSASLAGGIAHDFNNLLTVILGHSEFLLKREEPRERSRQRVEEIRKAAERGAWLTSQLLAYSRNQILEPAVLQMNSVLEDMDGILRCVLGEDIALDLVMDSNLGWTRVDPGKLQQIVLNLAGNARDAMPQGGRLRLETFNVSVNPQTPASAALCCSR